MTNSEKKKLLEEFKSTERRIRELEVEQNHLYNICMSSGAPDGMPRGRRISDKTARTVEKLERLTELIECERDELCDIEYRLLKAVSKLESVTSRSIIQLKYIGEPDGIYHRPLTLSEIADRLGYGIDRVKQLHIKAVGELKL